MAGSADGAAGDRLAEAQLVVVGVAQVELTLAPGLILRAVLDAVGREGAEPGGDRLHIRHAEIDRGAEGAVAGEGGEMDLRTAKRDGAIAGIALAPGPVGGGN